MTAPSVRHCHIGYLCSRRARAPEGADISTGSTNHHSMSIGATHFLSKLNSLGFNFVNIGTQDFLPIYLSVMSSPTAEAVLLPDLVNLALDGDKVLSQLDYSSF